MTLVAQRALTGRSVVCVGRVRLLLSCTTSGRDVTPPTGGSAGSPLLATVGAAVTNRRNAAPLPEPARSERRGAVAGPRWDYLALSGRRGCSAGGRRFRPSWKRRPVNLSLRDNASGLNLNAAAGEMAPRKSTAMPTYENFVGVCLRSRGCRCQLVEDK